MGRSRAVATGVIGLASVRSLALVLALVAPAGEARADGAFPDSMALFLPADRPHEILLATNFGLLFSEDDGGTWHWVCEQAIASLTSTYQMGPPPHRLFGLSTEGLVFSTDNACSWTQTGGGLAGAYVSDVFPDPIDPMRVLAIGSAPTDGGFSMLALFESSDGGASFRGPTYTPPAPSWVLSGVEIALANPSTEFLTAYDYLSNQPHPYLIQTDNGGQTWTTLDLAPSMGPKSVRLIGIDPVDMHKVYLRGLAANGDSLAIVQGQAVSVPLMLPAPMSTFLRRSDGRLYVATRDSGAFVSSDGGQTFAPWPSAPHLRALGERAGALYAVGDNFKDHFAVAVSTDDGATWRPLLRFDGICGLVQCEHVQSVCAGPWQNLVTMFAIPANVCGQGGTGGTGGHGSGGGCGCTVGERAAAAVWPWLGLGVLALLAIALARLIRG